MINEFINKINFILNKNEIELSKIDFTKSFILIFLEIYKSQNKNELLNIIDQENEQFKNYFYYFNNILINFSYEIKNLNISQEFQEIDQIFQKDFIKYIFNEVLKNSELNIKQFKNTEDYDIELKNMDYKKVLVIHGPDFSGKSFYLNEFVFNKNSIKIFLTPQTEYKNLLGNYICSKEPGNFEYKDGPLLYSIKNGNNLILENIENCKSEILYNIIKIIDENKLYHRSNIYIPNKNFFVTFLINTSLGQGNDYMNYINKFPFIYFLEMKEIEKNNIKSIIKKNYLNLSKIKDFIDNYFIFLDLFQNLFNNENMKINIYKSFKIFSIFKKFNIIFEEFNKSDYISTQLQRDMIIEIKNSFLEFLNYEQFKDLINNLDFPNFMNINKLEFFSYYENLNVIIEGNLNIIKTSKFKIIKNNNFLNQNIKILNNLNDFQLTNSNKIILEKILGCIEVNDIPLLIGETGCGKTTIIQKLAEFKNKNLNIINMSKQSDVSDFLGGFKPISHKIMIEKLFKKYLKFLNLIFNDENKIKNFYNLFKPLFKEKKYIAILKNIILSIDNNKNKFKEMYENKINKLKSIVNYFLENYNRIKNNIIFEYRKGILIESMENGDWILFDEWNLAENEVLINLLPIFDKNSITILEKGNLKEVKIKKEFKIFCCMNPESGIGKKRLPPEIKKKLFEINVKDIENYDELYLICYFKLISISNENIIKKITQIYKELLDLRDKCLIEESRNKKPNYSLRIFIRTLNIIKNAYKIKGISLIRAIYDGIICGFGSSLNFESKIKLKELFEKIFEITYKEIQDKIKNQSKLFLLNNNQMLFQNYILSKGNKIYENKPKYLITKSHIEIIEVILQTLSYSNYPILIEGPTSTGKTSLIYYLAYNTNNKVHRINNHEHTEIEEYIGQYIPNSKGNIIFQKGILIEAMENGDWLLLDELNLASSEILEALNRILDDNREIFIPELKKMIKPHPNFRIFATQNPTSYGGRKELSLAFQNRFIRIKFDEIKDEDLKEILMYKNDIINSRVEKLISLVNQLRNLRTTQNFFSGKESLITIRDLMKIASRGLNDYQELAYESYFILCERIRDDNEKKYLKEIIEKIFKNKINEDLYYLNYFKSKNLNKFTNIIFDKNFIRMFTLVNKALEYNESVLLIGDAGCGKTTLAELLSIHYKLKFYSINCHKYTEASDFLGSFRPKRNKEELIKELIEIINNEFKKNIDFDNISEFINSLEDSEKKINLKKKLNDINCLFEFKEGPLVQSVKNGGLILIDEISLAQDSVLEKLNSLFEVEKNLVIFDYINNDSKIIKAHKDFKIIATMNPSGDFGKRELTPALRNRFTEIWVIPSTNSDNLISQFKINEKFQILNEKEGLFNIIYNLFNFIENDKIKKDFSIILCQLCYYINVEYSLYLKNINLRDIKTIIEFINKTFNFLNPIDSLFEGIIIYLEGLKGTSIMEFDYFEILKKLNYDKINKKIIVENKINEFIIDEFILNKKDNNLCDQFYSLESETVKRNLKKIIKGIFIEKAILIEGPPGVGKTSIINYLAKLLGNKIFRINLSEQTDISDLFGFDIPTNKPGIFKWADGQFLKSMKNGDWILLDELNLASQSVLEGLNSILDHREMVYIPELDKVFKKHKDFKIFATQNPYKEGKGRKGLPLSFLSRFVRIYLEDFEKSELKLISKILFKKYSLNENLNFLENLFFLLNKYNEITNKEYNIRNLEKFFKYLNSNMNLISIINSFEIIFLSEIDDINVYNNIILKIENLFNFEFNQIKYGIDYLKLNDEYIYNNEFINTLVYGQNFLNKLIWKINFIIKYNTPILFNISNNNIIILEPLDIIKQLSINKNQPLVIIDLFKNSDISDLIGSYEQVNFLDRIKNEINNYDENNKYLKIFKKYCNENNWENIEILKEVDINLFDKIKWILNEKNKTIFKWIDSLFIEALKNGSWVILNNCQNTNSEILERLNSILEEETEFIISESINEEEGVKKINKHPNFRIFLIFDERKRSLNYSKALKNRCIEFNWNINFLNIKLDDIFEEYLKLFKYNLNNLNFIFDKIITNNSVDLFNYIKLLNYTNEYQYYLNNSLTNLIFNKNIKYNNYYTNTTNFINHWEKNYYFRIINYYIKINNNKKLFYINDNIINYLEDKNLNYDLLINEFGENVKNNFFKIFLYDYWLKNNNKLDKYSNNYIKNQFFNFLKSNDEFIINQNLDEENIPVIKIEKLINYFIYLIFNMKLSFSNIYIDNDNLNELISPRFNEICKFINNINPQLSKSISNLIFDKMKYYKDDFNFITILNEFKIVILNNYNKLIDVLNQNIIINNDENNEYESIIFIENENNINLITNCILYPDVIYEEDQLTSYKKEILNYFSLDNDFLNIFRNFYERDNFYLYKSIFENENFLDIKSLFEIIKYIKDSKVNYQYIKKLINIKNNKIKLKDINIIKQLIFDFENKLKNKNIIDWKNCIQVFKDNINYNFEKINNNFIELLSYLNYMNNEEMKIYKNEIQYLFSRNKYEIINNNLNFNFDEKIKNIKNRKIILEKEDNIIENNKIISLSVENFLSNFTKILSSCGDISQETKNLIEIIVNKIDKKEDIINELYNLLNQLSYNTELLFYYDILYEFLIKSGDYIINNYDFDNKDLSYYFLYNNKTILGNNFCNKNKDYLNKYKYLINLENYDINLEKEFVEYYSKKLINLSTELSKLQEVHKTKLNTEAAKNHKLNQELEKMVLNEYTKQAVEFNRKEKENEILNNFKTYEEEFEEFLPKNKKLKNFEDKDNINYINLQDVYQNKSNKFFNHLLFLWKDSLNYFIPKINNIQYLNIYILLKEVNINNNICKELIKNKLNSFMNKSINDVLIENNNKYEGINPLKNLVFEFLKEKIEKNTNFYIDTNHEELENLKNVIKNLIIYLNKLNSNILYRGLTTVNKYFKLCTSLIDIDFNSSLSKIAIAYQMLYTNLKDIFKSIPSKEHEKNLLENLLINLRKIRKIEKNNWKNLIKIKYKEILNKDLPFSLSLINEFSNDDSKLVVLIDEFIRRSNLGNFVQRIALLYLFKFKLNKKNQKIVEQIIFFYTNFKIEKEKIMKDLKSEIDKPMKENEKLMNWHFEDIINLKMNIQKLYKGINRSIKKQKEIWEMPIESYILTPARQNYLNELINQFIDKVNNDNLIKEENKKINVKKEQINSILKKEFTDIKLNKLYPIIKLISVKSLSNLFNGNLTKNKYSKIKLIKSSFNSLIRNMMEQIEILKDQNNNTFKFRALDNYFKILNEFEIKKKINFNTFDLNKLLDGIINWKFADKINEKYNKKFKIKDKFNKIYDRFYKIIDMIIILQNEKKYNENIPIFYIETIKSILVSLFIKFKNYLFNVDKIFKLSEKISKYNETNNQDLFKKELKEKLKIIQNEAKHILLINEISNDLENNEITNLNNISENKSFKLFKNKSEIFKNINLLIIDYKEFKNKKINKNIEKKLLNLEKYVWNLNKEILINDKEMDKSENLINLQYNLIKVIKKFYLNISYLLKNHKYIINQDFQKISQILEIHIFEHLYTFNKFSYLTSSILYNICYKGFCKKEEENEDDYNGKEEVYDGTGIGEGKGKENVTNEIEFEEQVLGGKDDENENSEESLDMNKEKEEDEMEMENDFKGKNYDEKKNEDDKNKKEKDDLDNEFDDVNNEDIDDKLFEDEDLKNEEEEEEEEDLEEKEELRDKDNLDINVDKIPENKDDELKAKEEENNKEERNIDSLDNYNNDKNSESENEEHKKEEEKMEEENNNLENEEENFASVKEASEMGSANSNEEYDYDENEKIEEKDDISEDNNSDNDISFSDKSKNNLENDNLEEKSESVLTEEFEDNLYNNERKIKEEDENQELLGDKLDSNINNNNNEDNKKKNNDLENFEKNNEDNEEYLKELQNFEEFKNNNEITKFIEDLKIKKNQNKSNNENEELIDEVEIVEDDNKLQTKAPNVKNLMKFDENKEKNDNKNKLADKSESEINSDIDSDLENKEEKNNNFKKSKIDKINKENNKGTKDSNNNNDISYNDLKKLENLNKREIKLEDNYNEENMKLKEKEICNYENADINWIRSFEKKVLELSEEFKSIFIPQKLSNLKGDFKTGKKLNMKKVIQFIASDYRKDKIWLRRNEPSERNYKIMIALDDSKSMSEQNVGKTALESLLILSWALDKINIGEISICLISDTLHLLHPFNQKISIEESLKIINSFSFEYQDRHSSDYSIKNFLDESIKIFNKEQDIYKICFIVGDGRFNKDIAKPSLKKAEEENIIYVYLIWDNKEEEKSIYKYRTVKKINGKITMFNYLDNFPFEYYLVVKDIKSLISSVSLIIKEFMVRSY